jgi:NAD(P)-dependent dehydrogenase (short-subunit alcohol dehydrogenase family)
MKRLEGKIAFITGAGSGIGHIAAGLFAQEGAAVIVADRMRDAGRRSAEEINARGGRALFIETDVTNELSLQSAFRQCEARFGRLDVLYNNAGGSSPKDVAVTDTDIGEFWRVIGVDLFGTWLTCKFGIPALIKAGGGSIINTSSMLAFIEPSAGCRPAKDSYASAKGGIVSLTRSMAVNYAKHNIRVNAVAPGMVVTDRVRAGLEADRIPKSLIDRHLLGPLDPIDIAHAALFLASGESRRITGQVFHVDSGITIS